jgi:hypothetical protein
MTSGGSRDPGLTSGWHVACKSPSYGKAIFPRNHVSVFLFRRDVRQWVRFGSEAPDAPVGSTMTEEPSLTNASVEENIVDVSLPQDPASSPASLPIARAHVGDAVILRGLGGGSFQQVGSELVNVSEGVALLNPQHPGLFPIRSAAEARISALLVVVSKKHAPERVLLLDDKAQGIERLDGLGNQLVVNGQVRPTLEVVQGSTERWHLFNVAERRVFLVALPGHLLSDSEGKALGELTLAPARGRPWTSRSPCQRALSLTSRASTVMRAPIWLKAGLSFVFSMSLNNRRSPDESPTYRRVRPDHADRFLCAGSRWSWWWRAHRTRGAGPGASAFAARADRPFVRRRTQRWWRETDGCAGGPKPSSAQTAAWR